MKFAVGGNQRGQEGIEYPLEQLGRNQLRFKSRRLKGPDHHTDFTGPNWAAHRSASRLHSNNTIVIAATGGVSPRRACSRAQRARSAPVSDRAYNTADAGRQLRRPRQLGLGEFPVVAPTAELIPG